jgi:hypothetical protein
MSPADSTRVQAIASDTTLDASVLAKGMLSILLDTLYARNPEPFTLPSSKYASEEVEWEVAESPTEAEYFKAYPNPFNQQITVAYDLKADCATGCFIRITDIQGRTVLEEPIIGTDGPNTIIFDLGKYQTGMYVCSLYNEERLLQTTRLIRME